MDSHIVYSFLVWVVIGLICVFISALLSGGRVEDFFHIFFSILVIGIVVSAIVSGVLSYLGVTNTIVSLLIVVALSIYGGIEFRHDLGFWNYNGTFSHFLKIIKNCIIYLPLTYFMVSYFFTLIFKKFLTLLAK